MNVNGAINAHVAWKQRLADYLEGKGDALDPAVVGRDDRCELGQWIHAEAPKRSADADFGALRAQHADFHKRAAAVIETRRRGDEAGARQLFAGEYVTAANMVIRTLGKMKALEG